MLWSPPGQTTNPEAGSGVFGKFQIISITPTKSSFWFKTLKLAKGFLPWQRGPQRKGVIMKGYCIRACESPRE